MILKLLCFATQISSTLFYLPNKFKPLQLQNWVEQEFEKPILYNTLFKYSQRHFGAKVKVARKSHVKKDEEAVSAFKNI